MCHEIRCAEWWLEGPGFRLYIIRGATNIITGKRTPVCRGLPKCLSQVARMEQKELSLIQQLKNTQVSKPIDSAAINTSSGRFQQGQHEHGRHFKLGDLSPKLFGGGNLSGTPGWVDSKHYHMCSYVKHGGGEIIRHSLLLIIERAAFPLNIHTRRSRWRGPADFMYCETSCKTEDVHGTADRHASRRNAQKILPNTTINKLLADPTSFQYSS